MMGQAFLYNSGNKKWTCLISYNNDGHGALFKWQQEKNLLDLLIS